MINYKKTIIFFLTLLVVITPVVIFAQEQTGSGRPLVPDCVINPDTGVCEWGFKQLIEMVNRVINFILFVMVVPIAAIMFCYAGFLLLTSGGESSKKTKAKNIFSNVVIGLIIAVAAWLIIHLVLSLLGYDGSWIGL